ncbi:branched-chain amino acid transport system II carrier protein [uncultured Algibacter sp.]|uniref:branched-chain amino acid transport system II carrier protein n=1 Tax=uncultured Algibacter sp. TaxID=298659 RepID=UPI002609DB8C|nr:branched-chain amino acid transport system II carrier protein [uncultured Algibacter sp.]
MNNTKETFVFGFASKLVFRWVIAITFIFSIPDFLGFIIDDYKLEFINNIMPLASQNLEWLLPSMIIFIFINLFEKVND